MSEKTRFGYHPALDGLRALAVVAVLLYHHGLDELPGGFLGVDAFFVLSGFLITSLLLAEHDAVGRISLRSFWARRARRLLPAVAVLIAGVALYAWLIADASELATIRRDGIATLLYAQNWVQVATGESYFTQFQAPSPFRHTWSLAIEEQWYLLWPLVLGRLLVAARGRTARIVPIVVVAALASAWWMAALHEPGGDPSRAYYGTDARAHQLLVGAALALLVAWWGPVRTPLGRKGVELAGLAGAALAVWLVTQVDDRSDAMYRGGFLVSAVAFALVIHAAMQPDGVTRRALGWEPLRRLGLISYGVYLFHWPVFLWLTPGRTGLDDPALLALRIGVTLVLALGSYWLVEMPIRNRTSPTVPARVLVPLGAAAVVVALVASTGSTPVGPRVRAVDADEIAVAPTVAPAPPSPLRVFLAGDSVALSVAYTDAAALVGLGADVLDGTQTGCGLATGDARIDGRWDAPSAECVTWLDRVRDRFTAHTPEVSVLLVGAWDVFDRRIDGRVLAVGTAEYEQYLVARLDEVRALVTAGGVPLVLLTTPCFGDPEFAISLRAPERTNPERVAWLNDVWRRYAARRSDVTVVDLHGWICAGGAPREEIDGQRMRPDGVHFDRQSALVVWRWLIPELRATLAT